MFSRIGTMELLVILAGLLLIFGPKNLPKLGEAVGKTIKGFKKGQEEISKEAESLSSDSAPEVKEVSISAEEKKETDSSK